MTGSVFWGHAFSAVRGVLHLCLPFYFLLVQSVKVSQWGTLEPSGVFPGPVHLHSLAHIPPRFPGVCQYIRSLLWTSQFLAPALFSRPPTPHFLVSFFAPVVISVSGVHHIEQLSLVSFDHHLREKASNIEQALSQVR